MAQTTYRIRGIAPPDLPRDSNLRRMFWGWVVEIGLRVKDSELARGLDKHGKKLRPITAKTAKYRRSAMTERKGRALSGPPLMPARELSRTRSLLAGRASEDQAVFYWRFDAFTGESWGQILAYQAAQGRDVIGLSPKGIAKVKAEAWERWRQWKAGALKVARAEASAAPGVPKVGSYSTTHATFGIGAHAAEKFGTGEWSGGTTWPEWQRYFRQVARRQVAIPGRPAGRYNRILAHLWGSGT